MSKPGADSRLALVPSMVLAVSGAEGAESTLSSTPLLTTVQLIPGSQKGRKAGAGEGDVFLGFCKLQSQLVSPHRLLKQAYPFTPARKYIALPRQLPAYKFRSAARPPCCLNHSEFEAIRINCASLFRK
eukprot:gene15138-21195_t